MATLPARPEFGLRVAVPEIDGDAEKQKILDKVGAHLGAIEVFGNRVLVAKFIRDKVGSLHRATSSQKEDSWQGKVGLVLAVGPLAFENDAQNDFRGQRAKVGDWVLYRYSDGADTDFVPPGTHERIPAKIIPDVDVQGVLARPDLFY